MGLLRSYPIQYLEVDLELVALPARDKLPGEVVEGEAAGLLLRFLVLQVYGLNYIGAVLVVDPFLRDHPPALGEQLHQRLPLVDAQRLHYADYSLSVAGGLSELEAPLDDLVHDLLLDAVELVLLLGVEQLQGTSSRIHGEVEHLVPADLRLVLLAVELPVGLRQVQ